MQMVDGKVDNPIPIEQFQPIIQNVANNEKQAFTIEEVGALVIAIVVVAEVTPVVLANIPGLAYYVKTFGIVQGIQMYRYLGIKNLPNGVISWLQIY